ncbi:PilZ domain-containing protein [Shewanella sp. CG12_big_fil_rev_8_21_14_0_65_47_15]|uniref:PilZ domain-containing protein n=1 Tax=Shewanella sp. CG12_big_fil_rev_8_21_14_0_65_47_15 TaxID=1975537 RepID=UPI000CB44897|nr:PilZ domain-containing protein [Shewanella sp. CG12_big_fil_rev_8_21_14_0_65_47_15]PIW61177.1 MAG: pilus assembly protein PilZ [Shewanella sp. CG12_big_fil_rev_8_21_14_0_65_47_15]
MGHHPTGFEEKRTSLRVDMEAERVLLHWSDQQGVEHTDEGVCIDLARRGILFDYKKPFALGELIEVTFNPNTSQQNTVKGQVCRCSQCHEQSYHIAMQLL